VNLDANAGIGIMPNGIQRPQPACDTKRLSSQNCGRNGFRVRLMKLGFKWQFCRSPVQPPTPPEVATMSFGVSD